MMRERLHRRGQTSGRLRLSALVGILLLLFASTAQVAHTHRSDLPQATHSGQKSPQQPQQKDTESLCPLCIAMHSVLPAVPQTVLVPVETAQAAERLQRVSFYVSLWRYELFGRPPPAAAEA